VSILSDLKMYARFAWGLRSFLRETITLEEAEAIVRKRLAEREDNFLRLVEKGIFGYPRSPYLPLLKLAQVEPGDIQNMVRRKGLEDTLRALRRAGVYITFEEFRGRAPVVRDGQVIPIRPTDFDNPYLSHYYQAETGGTTGAGARVNIDLDRIADTAANHLLSWDAHGIVGVPTAIWHSILPDSSGVSIILGAARFGQVPRKWFSVFSSRELRPSLKYSLATRFFVAMGRLYGVPVPWPERLPLSEAATIARWAAKTVQTHGKCVIRGAASRSLRVCLAAREEGLDLTGVIFTAGGEPLTEAKARQIALSGARAIPNYYFTEVGLVGMGCAHPLGNNDQHLCKDVLALIQCPRLLPGSGITVESFYFTTLLATTPKLLLNLEIDDYGIFERRSCGCPLESYGFTEHIRDIRSFGKLTGEGVTLVGSEMIQILEELLPARYGGSPLDYQLMEEEDEQGFTRLSLIVSPRIELADEQAVVQTVLEALGRSSVAADQARVIWRQAKTLRVKRMEPIWTARGKLMPLHLARRSPSSAESSRGSGLVSTMQKE
jgi:hypothetical protein